MKPSSVIAVTRGHGRALELFWSQRQYSMSFLGGFWSFVGGSVEEGDAALPMRGNFFGGFPDRSFYGCAARELFEELGLWVTTSGVRHVSQDPELAAIRAGLSYDEPAAFAAALRERGEQIDAERLLPTGKWETPEWFDLPFDSEFFTVALTSEEDAAFGDALADHMLVEELMDGEWVRPEDGLAAWRRAERYITLPIRKHVEALLGGSPQDVEVNSLDVPFHYAEWVAVPGIYMIPLKSPTIPPATHTNCLIVGDEHFVVIDPGSPNKRDQDGIATLVQQMLDDGRALVAVVLTHHHVDHVSGVKDLVERFACEVWAHANNAELVDFPITRYLADGEVIDLGADSLRCIFTPGHASGHLCFHHDRTNATIGGDLIASAGTILINPPDGHMGDYLASLAKIRDLAPGAIYPSHGWTVTNPVERLQHYIDHRLAREEKVFDALKRAPNSTATDLVPDAYDDAPPVVWPIAARSAQAHLVHLVEMGRATQNSGRYRALDLESRDR